MERSAFQFSLMALLVVTTLFACLLGLTMIIGRAIGVGETNALMTLLGHHIQYSPVLAVWLIGGAVIRKRWRRHPRASRHALIALGAMYLLLVASSNIRMWIQASLDPFGVPSRNMSMIFPAINFTWALLSAGCWVLLIKAILIDRPLEMGTGVEVERTSESGNAPTSLPPLAEDSGRKADGESRLQPR